MKRTLGWLIAGALLAWAVPASADVLEEDCASKDEGDACEDYAGNAGSCVLEGGQLHCEPTPDAGTTPSGDDDDDGDCSVSTIGAGGRGELAALGLLLIVCIALRKRFD